MLFFEFCSFFLWFFFRSRCCIACESWMCLDACSILLHTNKVEYGKNIKKKDSFAAFLSVCAPFLVEWIYRNIFLWLLTWLWKLVLNSVHVQCTHWYTSIFTSWIFSLPFFDSILFLQFILLFLHSLKSNRFTFSHFICCRSIGSAFFSPPLHHHHSHRRHFYIFFISISVHHFFLNSVKKFVLLLSVIQGFVELWFMYFSPRYFHCNRSFQM